MLVGNLGVGKPCVLFRFSARPRGGWAATRRSCPGWLEKYAVAVLGVRQEDLRDEVLAVGAPGRRRRGGPGLPAHLQGLAENGAGPVAGAER